jgi:glycosyltransferase involved in cell wall biosynthesis
VSGPSASEFTCVTYFPVAYSARGPGYSCASILETFPGAGIRTLLVLPRAHTPLPAGIESREAVPAPLRCVPWRVARRYATTAAMAWRFRRVASDVPGTAKVAYFWPDPPVELIQFARASGFVTVREMINTYRGTAKRVLDGEYGRLGLEPQHPISEPSVAHEREELAQYDYVLASNPLVEASLAEAGVPAHRVIPTSFGWSPERFPATGSGNALGPRTSLGALYVGTVCVRKGAHLLLEAWGRSGLPGTLTLAGDVEPALVPRVEAATASGRVRHLPYAADVNRLYRSADFFVFPTLEEGGPQVVYEAAGCGLPVVTTPAGAARLIVDGENGYVVDPASVDALVAAMTRLADDPVLCSRFGAAAAEGARRFDYRIVGRERADAMRRVIPAGEVRRSEDELAPAERLGVGTRGAALHPTQTHQPEEQLLGKPVLAPRKTLRRHVASSRGT